ncbi:MAG TPA: TIGR04255 family protein [Frateuria sp.]|uniref:TIGR04255 family protein n=1 Tax=Frateuria sp. TaxID=2211372 RepID=UPI002DEF283F|nr:TIGR04255 family protein [Frateuria sp.]
MAKLTYAPVFFVVAHVTHSPVLKLGSLIPELQDRLRKVGFPGYRQHTQMTLTVGANMAVPGEAQVNQGQVSSHIFSGRDPSESFVVGQDGFALQTVEYETIEDFSLKFRRGMEVIKEILAPDSVTRVGMRFIDAVVPPPGGALSDYIREQFLGLTNTPRDDWFITYNFNESLHTRGDQQTKTRILTQNGQLTYPPDLAGPIVPTLPARFAEINGVHTLIDTDSWFATGSEIALEFDPRVIVDRLSSLKADIRDSFLAVVTDAALQAWK